MKVKITTVKIDTVVHCGEPLKYAIMVEDDYGTEVYYVSHRISNLMGVDILKYLDGINAHEDATDCILENMLLSQNGAIVNGEWMDYEQIRPWFSFS